MSVTIDGSASVTINSGAVLGITSGTAVASTSGTSIDFTSIPSWVKRITVMFQGLSTNGASEYVVRIGDSSGVAATGYTGAYAINASASLSTTGFGIANGGSTTATIMNGTVVITALDLATYKYTCMYVHICWYMHFSQ